MYRTTLLLSILFLSACATSGPRRAEYTQADKSCVEGDLANIAKYFFKDEAHVAIRFIDGLATNGKHRFCVEPGVHYVTAAAVSAGFAEGQTYVQLTMEPGKTYKIRAVRENSTTFIFRVLEVVGAQEHELQQLRSFAGDARRR